MPRKPPEEVFSELSVVLEVLGDLTDETLEGQLRGDWKKVSLDRQKVFLEAGSPGGKYVFLEQGRKVS